MPQLAKHTVTTYFFLYCFQGAMRSSLFKVDYGDGSPGFLKVYQRSKRPNFHSSFVTLFSEECFCLLQPIFKLYI